MKRKTGILLTITICLIGAATVIGLIRSMKKYSSTRAIALVQTIFKGKDIFICRRLPTNEKLVDQAYMRLANKLLDDYLQNKDSQLVNEVVELRVVPSYRSRLADWH
jgi:hypothetical protein